MSTEVKEVFPLEIMKNAMKKASEHPVEIAIDYPELTEKEKDFGKLEETNEELISDVVKDYSFRVNAPLVEGTRSEQLLEEILSQLKGVNKHLKQLRNIALSIPMSMEELD